MPKWLPGSPKDFFPWGHAWHALFVLGLCLGSRLLTTIHYIEDADSMRFALAVKDYDLTRLQPHFPGYPVFCFFAKILHGLTGSYALAFSLAGGLGQFGIMHYALSILGIPARSLQGIWLLLLLFFNPMLWLMGNRYMPDLTGVACLLAAFHHLAVSEKRHGPVLGFFLAGILAGWRLSYLPFLAVPILISLLKKDTLQKLAAGTFGIVIWFIPLLVMTGWEGFRIAAEKQTTGHFTEFGGTLQTEPDLLLRVVKMLEGAWSDGLGAYWPGRHWITALVGIGMAIGLILGLNALRKGGVPEGRLRLAALCALVYALWILLGQNVLYQSRHVLPLVPLLLMVASLGLARLRPRPAPLALVACYAIVCLVLVVQHKRPTAVAQVRQYLASLPGPGLHVVTIPLLGDYFAAQGVKARFLSLESEEEKKAIRDLGPETPIVVVGDFGGVTRRTAKEKRTFYHNPYVNRLWPEMAVTRY